MTTASDFNLSDFHISMEKITVPALAIDDLFIPVGYGDENFTVFKVIERKPLDVVAERLDDGRQALFVHTDKVVRANRKDVPARFRIYDIDVHEGFAQKWSHNPETSQHEFRSPMTITFQKSDRFGQFEEIPSTRGMVPGSDEHTTTIEVIEKMEAELPTIDFDFADFLAFQMEHGSEVHDYDVTQRDGVAALNNMENMGDGSECGFYYVSFEEAYEHFDLSEYESFIADQVAKKATVSA